MLKYIVKFNPKVKLKTAFLHSSRIKKMTGYTYNADVGLL